jgi:antirestriction protein
MTAKKMTEENGLDEEVNQAYIDLVGEEYANADNCAEVYQGHYNSDEEFTQELVEDVGDIPKDLPCYIHIDWEKTATDIMMDYGEVNGYYFRNL